MRLRGCFGRDLLWLATACALATLPLLVAPDEPDLTRRPEITARPAPRLAGLRGLRVPARDGLPTWRAERATPRPGEGLGGFVTLAGTLDGLQLERVELELGAGCVLRAERGTARDGELALEAIVAQGPDEVELLAAAGVWRGGRIRFTGAVALRRRGAEPFAVRVDPEFGHAELTAALEGR